MLVLGGSSGALEVSVLGVFLAFCAALSFALEGVGLRMIERDAYETIAMVSGVSALMALPWLVAGDAAWMLTPRGALCMALLTFLSTVIPYTLFTIGVQNVELGVVYTLGLAEPLTAWVPLDRASRRAPLAARLRGRRGALLRHPAARRSRRKTNDGARRELKPRA